MGVYKMLELLQAKDKGYIILVNIGSFYITAGKDAVLLHNILNLKVNCVNGIIICRKMAKKMSFFLHIFCLSILWYNIVMFTMKGGNKNGISRIRYHFKGGD